MPFYPSNHTLDKKLAQTQCSLCQQQLPQNPGQVLKFPCFCGHYFCASCVFYHLMTVEKKPFCTVECPTCNLPALVSAFTLEDHVLTTVPCELCHQQFQDFSQIVEFPCLFAHQFCKSCLYYSMEHGDDPLLCPACHKTMPDLTQCDDWLCVPAVHKVV